MAGGRGGGSSRHGRGGGEGQGARGRCRRGQRRRRGREGQGGGAEAEASGGLRGGRRSRGGGGRQHGRGGPAAGGAVLVHRRGAGRAPAGEGHVAEGSAAAPVPLPGGGGLLHAHGHDPRAGRQRAPGGGVQRRQEALRERPPPAHGRAGGADAAEDRAADPGTRAARAAQVHGDPQPAAHGVRGRLHRARAGRVRALLRGLPHPGGRQQRGHQGLLPQRHAADLPAAPRLWAVARAPWPRPLLGRQPGQPCPSRLPPKRRAPRGGAPGRRG
mmetsp:Transcript_49593/g.146544  ORF Transcript_49593/g.146544 Transcript_49593/m.146544 type:complete len:272 (-) Transcript_49593:158-973(-)